MKLLITGISGMIGSRWALRAMSRGWEVYGIDKIKNPILKPIFPNIYNCDILDSAVLEKTLKEIKPDITIHLAAQAFSSLSWELEESTHEINYMGTFKLLHAVREIVPESKILLSSSSVVYGRVEPEDCPLHEELPLKPATPYAVTKAAGELLAQQYFRCYGTQVFLPRFFNLLAPASHSNTAVQNFARQLALIAGKKQEPVLRTGMLTAARDFLDVEDAITAMEIILEKGTPAAPVNICSQKAVTISDMLDQLIAITGQTVEIKAEKDPDREIDEPLLYGNNTRLKNLGWKPVVPISDSLKQIYQHWLDRV